MFKLVIATAFFVTSAACPWPARAAEELPALPVETLAGTPLTLPADLPGGALFFTIGFSRASRHETADWSRRMEREYGRSGGMALYEVAVLEEVPRLIRGFVIDAIRSDVPQRLHDRFLLATQSAQDWKRLASFAEADSAYLVLVDRHHQIVWHGNGRLTDASFQALAERLKAMGVEAKASP